MIIDVDEPSTWPGPLLVWAKTRAKQLDGTTEFTSDLEVGYDVAEFESLIAGHLLRVYHCTRLLDHEVEAVLQEGLRVGSEDLVSRRLDAAVDAGYLTRDLAGELLAGNMLRQGREQVEARENSVCACTTRSRSTATPTGSNG